ncbi:CBS domain-containing protein [Aliamphritea spongicola]|nr:CBS domain-containing protein [Aliamphritea spongicola]
MDEPFGAIDPINREVIQDEFLKMQEELQKTILFVSHDIDEAVKMADKIAIFNAGKLIQFDSPDALLAHPCNKFVEDFVGTDRTLKRLRLAKVADVMTPAPTPVKPDDDLQTALEIMQNNDYVAVTMVDTLGRPIGSITGIWPPPSGAVAGTTSMGCGPLPGWMMTCAVWPLPCSVKTPLGCPVWTMKAFSGVRFPSGA